MGFMVVVVLVCIGIAIHSYYQLEQAYAEMARMKADDERVAREMLRQSKAQMDAAARDSALRAYQARQR
jgi:hypothetical protein